MATYIAWEVGIYYVYIIFQKASTYISTTVLASFPNANRLLFAYFWFLITYYIVTPYLSCDFFSCFKYASYAFFLAHAEANISYQPKFSRITIRDGRPDSHPLVGLQGGDRVSRRCGSGQNPGGSRDPQSWAESEHTDQQLEEQGTYAGDARKRAYYVGLWSQSTRGWTN